MKWLKIGLLVIVLLSLIQSSVLADTSGDVVVTVTPDYVTLGPPHNFRVTYITDTKVRLDWLMDPLATNIMIRGQIGSYPASVTEGYQIYYGTDITFTDTAVNLDECSRVYYRAWSENPGTWSNLFAQGSVEGVGVVLIAEALSNIGITAIALVVLVLISALAFWRPIAPLFMIMAGMALMIGLSWYDIYTNEMGMAISLCLIGYSFLCIGYTFKVIFARVGDE